MTRQNPLDRLTAPAFLLLAMVAGCGNLYHEHYLSLLDRRNQDEASRILPARVPPKVVSSRNLKEDSLRMREDGYLLVGHSSFNSTYLDEGQALDQARKVGAEVVLVNQRYINTVTQSVPMSQWVPGQQENHQETTVIQQGAATPTIIQRQSSTQLEGQYQTTYVDENVDYYEYDATFWAPSKQSPIGVLVKPLDGASRSLVGSNKGVRVRAVVKDSPAYEADILRDDILVSLGEDLIRDPNQFFQLVKDAQGQEVPIQLYRGGKPMVVKVRIGKE